MVKFKKRINDFTHIIGVDLATYRTGVSVYNITEKQICEYREIEVQKKSEQKIIDLYYLTSAFLKEMVEKYGNKLMLIREACPSQNGPFTTISVLQSLAKSHGVLDLCVGLQEGIEEYDSVGVYSISVKSLFRSEVIPKPQKGDIGKELAEIYKLDQTKLTDNITDSIAVIHTLINHKWNQDIKAEIKNYKTEIKKLKQQKAINSHQLEIEKLMSLII